jgi:hypothetical protein
MAKAKRSPASAAAGRRAARGPAPAPEFSRPANVARIGRLEHRMEIKANAEERAALAARFDLVELAELKAELILKKRGDDAPGAGVVELTGRWHARVAQSCVVTLEPVWADLADDVRLFFGGPLEARGGDAVADPFDDEGWPEPIQDGVIDVGEAVAQLLGVALDPYPRAPGAAAPPADGAT